MRKPHRSKNRGEHFGVMFDDIVDDHTAGDWSQVCSRCVRKYGLPKKSLDQYDIDSDTKCGIRVCNNTAEYFITFDRGYEK
jgi:hypothetical protein|tara:strand:- start:246 stop:488 length:243 start_codon:yes stop_codon:yes gene_type:complete